MNPGFPTGPNGMIQGNYFISISLHYLIQEDLKIQDFRMHAIPNLLLCLDVNTNGIVVRIEGWGWEAWTHLNSCLKTYTYIHIYTHIHTHIYAYIHTHTPLSIYPLTPSGCRDTRSCGAPSGSEAALFYSIPRSTPVLAHSIPLRKAQIPIIQAYDYLFNVMSIKNQRVSASTRLAHG